MRFLFWNVYRRPMATYIGELAASEPLDLIAVAESTEPASLYLKILNARTSEWHLCGCGTNRLIVFARFPSRYFREVLSTAYTSVRLLRLPALETLIIGVVHLPSKLYAGKDSQILIAGALNDDIERVEAKHKHRRTILVGDFNMDPFETGMVAAGALHAVIDSDLAAERTRTVHERPYNYFYNPMWRHYRDEAGLPCGTYFKRRSEEACHFWHIFDQVVIRPEVIPLIPDAVQVMTAIGRHSLIDHQGRPDTKRFSDHLPIMFEVLLQ
jgi:hypothetical protein